MKKSLCFPFASFKFYLNDTLKFYFYSARLRLSTFHYENFSQENMIFDSEVVLFLHGICLFLIYNSKFLDF